MFEFKMDTLHPEECEDLIECSDYTALSLWHSKMLRLERE